MNDCNGCPYRSFDPVALRATLERRHGRGSAVDAICADAAAGLAEVACARELEVTLLRAGGASTEISTLVPQGHMPSPNHYFNVWRQIRGRAGAAAPASAGAPASA